MDKNQDKNLHSLSIRGYQYAITLSRIDNALFMEAKQNLYNPEDNPLGSFTLNMAENQLMAPILKSKLSNYLKANEMPDWILGYTLFGASLNKIADCTIHGASLV